MEGFMIRDRHLILPGWRWLSEPEVGVATPRGAEPARRTAVLVPGLLDS